MALPEQARDEALLTYDVVMATRNRSSAVALSLPLILTQTRACARIVVVDSSDDDGAAIGDLVTSLASRFGREIVFLTSPPGLTKQRNLGLQHTTADVVIFPDDDSLLYLDTAEKMLAVYEASESVAAVCATPAVVPPDGSLDLTSYVAETQNSTQKAARKLRQIIKETAACANPFLAVGNRLNAQQSVPDLPEHIDAAPVPYMTGFRMSFRREVITRHGFDETLRRYGWFEDIDASWGAMREGVVLMAKHANIYHHRDASNRAGGYAMGLWAILNRAYVVAKHVRANPDIFPNPEREFARLRRYCKLRIIAYRVLARDEFSKQRADGARDGLNYLPKLLAADVEQLPSAYTDLERILIE
ncbi:glycosyltransferase family 2 protein [Qingshengfaniella alkalisoli]|uniref:Glycosyltransferase family 2 protein n=1 Tax=Qingshengfaniella alkalisoli TaxID=2599296 RepID=A0A5B8IAK7_9RHOB|nr:glycosyltransferase [Qingshengfaniella alkalisoli]QDY71545.1 glycosyltransferase family 2 protein [Qingshengfaniella alkalisoli]